MGFCSLGLSLDQCPPFVAACSYSVPHHQPWTLLETPNLFPWSTSFVVVSSLDFLHIPPSYSYSHFGSSFPPHLLEPKLILLLCSGSQPMPAIGPVTSQCLRPVLLLQLLPLHWLLPSLQSVLFFTVISLLILAGGYDFHLSPPTHSR